MSLRFRSFFEPPISVGNFNKHLQTGGLLFLILGFFVPFALSFIPHPDASAFPHNALYSAAITALQSCSIFTSPFTSPAMVLSVLAASMLLFRIRGAFWVTRIALVSHVFAAIARLYTLFFLLIGFRFDWCTAPIDWCYGKDMQQYIQHGFDDVLTLPNQPLLGIFASLLLSLVCSAILIAMTSLLLRKFEPFGKTMPLSASPSVGVRSLTLFVVVNALLTCSMFSLLLRAICISSIYSSTIYLPYMFALDDYNTAFGAVILLLTCTFIFVAPVLQKHRHRILLTSSIFLPLLLYIVALVSRDATATQTVFSDVENELYRMFYYDLLKYAFFTQVGTFTWISVTSGPLTPKPFSYAVAYSMIPLYAILVYVRVLMQWLPLEQTLLPLLLIVASYVIVIRNVRRRNRPSATTV